MTELLTDAERGAGKPARPEGALVQALDRHGVVGRFGQDGEREIGHGVRHTITSVAATSTRPASHSALGYKHRHHFAARGAPSSTSASRRRVPGVVSAGKASSAKKPWAMISPLGCGERSWRNTRTTNTAMWSRFETARLRNTPWSGGVPTSSIFPSPA